MSTRGRFNLMALSTAIALATAAFAGPVVLSAVQAASGSAPGPVISYPWHTTRAELLRMIDDSSSRDDRFYAPFENSSNPKVAADARTDHARVAQIIARNRLDVARLPDGPITRYFPLRTLVPRQASMAMAGAVVAEASVVDGWTVYTYYNSGGGQEAGFIGNMFANEHGYPYSYGLAAAVRGDLEGPTANSNPPWQDGGGLPLWVLICVNSICTWQTQVADLQILDYNTTICNSSGVCVNGQPCDPSAQCPRKHMSLWDSGGPDSTGDGFSVGDSHHDILGHACPDDWDNTRDYAGKSVPTLDVYGTTYSDSGNAGTISCGSGYTPAYHDGWEFNVYLQGQG